MADARKSPDPTPDAPPRGPRSRLSAPQGELDPQDVRGPESAADGRTGLSSSTAEAALARVREVRAWLAAEADRCRLLAEDELPAEIRVATNSMATAHRLAVRLLDGALGGSEAPR